MPSVSVNLDVTVDASGQLSVFGQAAETMSNVVIASITLPTADLYNGVGDGVLRFQQPTSDINTIVGERYLGFSGSVNSLAADIKTILKGTFNVSAADPFSTYSADYHTAPDFGYLALGAYAHSLFGHVQATAAIDNDLAFVSKMVNDGVGDAALNRALAQAIYGLSDAKSTQVAKQVIGQDASRTSASDNTQATPSVWQALEFKNDDVIYMSIRLLQPSVVVSNAAQKSAPAASLYSTKTYVLKITLGDGSPAADPGSSGSSGSGSSGSGGSGSGSGSGSNPGPEPAPVITYTTPNTYSIGATASLTPTNTGGVAVAYSVSPSLAPDFSIDPVTGVISGTTTLAKSASYTVTAENADGLTGTFAVTITVNPNPAINAPNITYANTNNVTIAQSEIQTIPVVSNSGSPVVLFELDPLSTLPDGMNLNAQTGAISGNTSNIGTRNVTIIASNAGGTQSVTLTINIMAKPAFNYTSPVYIKQNVAMESLVPTTTGGQINGFVSAGPLPAGLSMDASGVITGTPTTISSLVTYTVQAINAAGDGYATIQIMVFDPVIGPPITPSISYPSEPLNGFIAYVGVPTNIQSRSRGGYSDTTTVVLSLTDEPTTLPNGLGIDAEGNITGTPTAQQDLISYTLTFTNSHGAQQPVAIRICVVLEPPNVTYPSAGEYYLGTAISPLVPTNTGGPVAIWQSSTLPSGLFVDHQTGIITGTPEYLYDQTAIVSAENNGGIDNVNIPMKVNNVKPAFSYNIPLTVNATYPFSFTPTVTAGTAFEYTTTGIPNWMSLDFYNGQIIGTPTMKIAATEYMIIATNNIDSTSITFTIEVLNPPRFSYPSQSLNLYETYAQTFNPYLYPNAGDVVTWTVSPTLPAGLELDEVTGQISGAPTTVQAAANYVIRGENADGHFNFTISITVNELTPPNITYPAEPQIFWINSNNNILVTNTGGPVVANDITSVSPALPTGIEFFSGGNGNIYVNVATQVPLTTYTVTFTGLDGTVITAPVQIQIKAPIPTVSYGTNYTLSQGAPASIGPNGAHDDIIDSYSVSPQLPEGLEIDEVTGAISGTPTVLQSSAPYVVSITNLTGSQTFTINISVVPLVPPQLQYSAAHYTFNQGVNIGDITPSNIGGPITFTSISPALPNGLGITDFDGSISGTTNELTSTTLHTVTATGLGGTTTTTFTVTVV